MTTAEVAILPTLAPPLTPAERNVLASLHADLRTAHGNGATWQVRAALVEGAAVVLAALAGEGAS